MLHTSQIYPCAYVSNGFFHFCPKMAQRPTGGQSIFRIRKRRNARGDLFLNAAQDEAWFDEQFKVYINRAKRLFPKYTEEELKEKALVLMNCPQRPADAPLPPPPQPSLSRRVDNNTLISHIPLSV